MSSKFSVVKRVVEDIVNMSADQILELSLEIIRYQSLLEGRWVTMYYDLWLGSVTIDNEVQPYGIRTDGYVYVGDDLYTVDWFKEYSSKLRVLFEELEELLKCF